MMNSGKRNVKIKFIALGLTTSLLALLRSTVKLKTEIFEDSEKDWYLSGLLLIK